MFIEWRTELQPFWCKIDAKIGSKLKILTKLKFQGVSYAQKDFRAPKSDVHALSLIRIPVLDTRNYCSNSGSLVMILLCADTCTVSQEVWIWGFEHLHVIECSYGRFSLLSRCSKICGQTNENFGLLFECPNKRVDASSMLVDAWKSCFECSKVRFWARVCYFLFSEAFMKFFVGIYAYVLRPFFSHSFTIKIPPLLYFFSFLFLPPLLELGELGEESSLLWCCRGS